MEQPKMDTQIRVAVAADAPLIADVLYTAFAEYGPSYTPGGFTASTPSAEQILSRMYDGPAWVALQNGAVVGTVSATLRGESLYVRSMAVLPGARGGGIGKLLLDSAEAYALEHNCRCLFLSTTPFLSGAIRLYEQAGFVRSDEGSSDLSGTPLFTMEKQV